MDDHHAVPDGGGSTDTSRSLRGPGLLAIGLTAFFSATLARGATFTVTTAADSGSGSLRQAILDSNAAAGPDIIAFSVGNGVATIAPLTALPALTDPVTIDGETQPGFLGTPVIELDGSEHAIDGNGLEDAAGDSTVRALAIGGFGDYGILLSGGSPSLVEGCFVGLDASGTITRGNGLAGIAVIAGAHQIGGSAPGMGNVISGQAIGLVMSSPQSGNVVVGNWIGLRQDGVAAGDSLGIDLSSPGTLIGGSSPGAGNVVSGHRGDAIHVSAGSEGSMIQGNRIGTDPTGAFAIPNTAGGVNISGASGVLVGGTEPGAGNIISGNGGNALTILGTGNVVQGNLLGTDATGSSAIPNGQGVSLGEALGNVIGGVGSSEGNVIAFNEVSGVVVLSGTGNTIRGNSTFDNGGLGIDLVPPHVALGHTPNDADDLDEGGNDLQNFPVIESVERFPGSTHIAGGLLGAHGGTYTIDFYADSACVPRPRAFAQARTHLGEIVVTGAGARPGHSDGRIAFETTLSVVLAPDEVVTATATDAAGSTSEISSGILFDVAPRSGSASGGEALVLRGTDFADDATVTIGGVAVSSVVADEATIAAVSPALPPGTVASVAVLSEEGPEGSLAFAWLADFLDVPASHLFHDSVAALVTNGIAVGCGSGQFCADTPVTRSQAAPLLLRARDGVCAAPPSCTGAFADVPCPGPFADWIEALAAEGVTAGCSADQYCPDAPVRRDQVAVLLLKTRFGGSYSPPPCTGVFADVACPSAFADWIEDLAAQNIAAGCGNGSYCPSSAVTRGQMAALLARTFTLP